MILKKYLKGGGGVWLYNHTSQTRTKGGQA